MSKTTFNECSLREVDFGDAILKESKFIKCDLLRATFSHTNLEKCDFTTSYDFNIDPDDNILKKAKFSLSEVMGLLAKHEIILES